MADFFYDEDEGWEVWSSFRQEAQRVEKEYLEMRTALRDADAALRKDPGNEELQLQVKELGAKLEELEERAPWLTSPYPIEVLLWGTPHG
jgi:DNA-binding transcriptional regulator GbsR (MarR family)